MRAVWWQFMKALTAYEYDNQIYVPQIIENVDESCYEIIKVICQNIKILPPSVYNIIN